MPAARTLLKPQEGIREVSLKACRKRPPPRVAPAWAQGTRPSERVWFFWDWARLLAGGWGRGR